MHGSLNGQEEPDKHTNEQHRVGSQTDSHLQSLTKGIIFPNRCPFVFLNFYQLSKFFFRSQDSAFHEEFGDGNAGSAGNYIDHGQRLCCRLDVTSFHSSLCFFVRLFRSMLLSTVLHWVQFLLLKMIRSKW